jgi:GTP-binding protein Era
VIHLPKRKGRPGAQVVLIDTPGVHRPDSSLGKKMMSEVREALNGCDLVLLITDSTRRDEASDPLLFKLLEKSGTPIFLLLNKIDLLGGEKRKLLPLIEQYAKLHGFREIIPISAKKAEGLDLLLEKVVAGLPQGPPYFPQDQITDQPARFMVSELIREQVLLNTAEEVPHSVTVLTETFEELPRLTRIAAAIYCEREGQKRILIGHQGQMLKKIGTSARLEMEKMLGTKVFLELFVKVRANWREARGFVEELDWRKQLEHLVTGATGPEPDSA